MKFRLCEDIKPVRVDKEFKGAHGEVPGDAIAFFQKKADEWCDDGNCSEGKCVGHWRDLKNEAGTEPGKRKYSAEVYCKCEIDNS